MLKRLLIPIVFCIFAVSTQGQANCLPQFFNDFEGQTSGSTATTTTLALTDWADSGSWDQAGTITYDSGASMPLPDPTGVLCATSTSYPTETQLNGLTLTGTGTQASRYVRYTFSSGQRTNNSVTAATWFCSDIPSNSAQDFDTFLIGGSSGGDYINILNLTGSNAVGGSGFNMHIETDAMIPPSNNWGYFVYSPGNGCGSNGTGWVLLVLQFNNSGPQTCNTSSTGGGAAAYCHNFRAYNYLGQPIPCTGSTTATSCADGFTLAGPSTGTGFARSTTLGNLGSQDIGSGNHNHWDSLQLNFSGTFPIAHSCIPPDLTAADVQTAINNCPTGGYVDLPATSGTWTTQVTAAPTGSLTIQGKTACTAGCAPGSHGTSLAFTDNTNIDLNYASGSSLSISGCSNSAFCTVNNISFTNGNAQSHGQFALTGTHGQVGFRLSNLHWVDSLGTTGGVMTAITEVWGLIDHVLADNASGAGWNGPIRVDGDYLSNGEADWNATTSLGSNQAVIVEDSSFTNSGGGCASHSNLCTEGVYDGYNGCKVTVRYSSVNGTEFGGGHGTDTNASRGCVTQEIYNNALTNCPSTGTFGMMNVRSGALLFDNNAVTGTCTGIDLQYLRYGGQNSAARYFGYASSTLNWTPLSATPSNSNSMVMTLNASNFVASHAYAANATVAPASGNAGAYNFELTNGPKTCGTYPAGWSQSPFTGSTTDSAGCIWLNVGGSTSAGPGGSGFCAANPDTPATSNSTCNALSGGDTATRFFDCSSGVGTCPGAGYPYRDQPCVVHNQVVYGCYEWSNSGAGLPSPVFTTDSATSTVIVSSRDYFLTGPPAGYTAYTYPDPLQGGGGTVVLSPNSENFGSINVGSSSGPVTFTLTNNNAVTATSIAPTTTGGNASDFVITNSGAGSCSAAGNQIAMSASCTFTVVFTPSSSGSRGTTLRVAYSGGDGASPQTSTLSGTGTLIPSTGTVMSDGVQISNGVKVQ